MEGAVGFLGLHRRQTLQLAGAALLAVALGIGIYYWMDHNQTVRSEKLSEAMQVSDAPVNPVSQPNVLSYPSQQAKDAAETKAFSEVAAQYSGSKEGAVAEYTLAGMAVTAGRNDEARKRFQSVVDSGNKDYASLAKLALAQLDFGENKPADGEKLLRELIDHPTALVSKDQATITLARMISHTRPAEARALLTPLIRETGQSGQAANSVMSDISAK